MDRHEDPREFLVRVMNDETIEGTLRVKAAAALVAVDNALQRAREERAFQRFVAENFCAHLEGGK